MLFLPSLTAADPLPAIQPGALTQLAQLDVTLIFQEQPVPLPPSWGDPAAWPSLTLLKLVAPIALPLPASWAHGFPALQDLVLTSNVDHLTPIGPAADASRVERPESSARRHGSSPHPLPAEWARGFPKLQSLTLTTLGVNGTFPAAWQASGSFPQLREM